MPTDCLSPSELGARLRQRRGDRTQVEIAAASGVGQTSVSRAETGDPRYHAAREQLAAFYGIALDGPFFRMTE